MDVTKAGVGVLKNLKTFLSECLYLGNGGRRLLGGYAVDQANRPDP